MANKRQKKKAAKRFYKEHQKEMEQNHSHIAEKSEFSHKSEHADEQTAVKERSNEEVTADEKETVSSSVEKPMFQDSSHPLFSEPAASPNQRNTYHQTADGGAAYRKKMRKRRRIRQLAKQAKEQELKKSQKQYEKAVSKEQDSGSSQDFVFEGEGNGQFKENKKLDSSFKKYEKAEQKLKDAQKKIKRKKRMAIKRNFDEEKQKVKYAVVAFEVEKTDSPGPIKNGVNRTRQETIHFVHGKIAEVEKENSAVEGAHKAEQTAEDIYQFVKYHKKSKAQRKRDKVTRLEKKRDKSAFEFEYQKFIAENPQLDEHERRKIVRRKLQKARLKREYAKKLKKKAEEKAAFDFFQKGKEASIGIAKKLVEGARTRSSLLLVMGVLALFLIVIMASISSCGAMLGEAISVTVASSYLSEPKEIDAADLSFSEKEMNLQNKIDNIESDYPGYDEYRYNISPIGHNPFTLISYLSAVYTEFKAADVEAEIQALFDASYHLDITPTTETRYRTVSTPDGGTAQQAYTVKILQVTLSVTPLETVVQPKMNEEQKEMYELYAETKGLLQIFVSPVKYNWYQCISDYYGYRKNPSTGNSELHRGLDIAVPEGTDVYAGHDGTVLEARYDSYYGNYVVLRNSEGYTTKYAHLQTLNVHAGQSVSAKDVIGKSGNSGTSTGNHLHIECMHNGEYYNPLFYFDTGTETPNFGVSGAGGGNYPGAASRPPGVPAPDAYDDVAVQNLLTEAERYLGMPYTFGGTPPQSFDCSAFVCWVFSNSGTYHLPRTTAQAIYDQCTPVTASEARAGDIIFFTGTYNAGRPVTHVGIYCGNGTMIHCGNPIQYTSVNTPYWQSHFYGFGRLR